MATTMQLRGYIPRTLRYGSIDTTGFRIPFQFDSALGEGRQERGISARLRMRSSAAIRVFWTEEDYDANVNYFVCDSVNTSIELPVEAREIWIRGASGTVSFFELTVFLRRG